MKKEFIVIAGPCSAENEEQILHVADRFSTRGGVDYLRAGLFKPRTRPGGFEGVGFRGLKWLEKAKTFYGTKTAIEVGAVHQAREAILSGIDLLWIGSRTSGDPMTVDNIAKQIKYVCEELNHSLPVIAVKNPMYPDVDAWVGAIERFTQLGFPTVYAIHRGFKTQSKRFRNEPLWNLALEFRARLPEIPLLIDPSHIVGASTESLYNTAAIATALNYDGIMIEVHPNPAVAITDRDQQINIATFYDFMARLAGLRLEEESKGWQTIAAFRTEIDSVDHRLLELIDYRISFAKRIGKIKKENGISLVDEKREDKVVESFIEYGTLLGFPKEILEDIILDIVHLSKYIQKNQGK